MDWNFQEDTKERPEEITLYLPKVKKYKQENQKSISQTTWICGQRY